MKNQINWITPIRATAAAFLVVCLATATVSAGSPPSPGQSSAFGKSLAQWEDIYSQFAFGTISPPTDQNGNAVVGSHVVLMPVPAAGSLDVTLSAGQAFVLPLWCLFLTTYNDGTPPDPIMDLSVFQTLDITFSIDGDTVIDGSNVMDYYSEFPFEPVIPYNVGYYKDIFFFQGIGFIHPPLSVGEHTLRLDAKNTEPVVDAKGQSWTYEYHNTWNITVAHR